MNIQEAAKEYADGQYEPTDRGILYRETQDDFIAGAKWQAKQSPWISVEDRLPDYLEKVLVLYEYKGGNTNPTKFLFGRKRLEVWL